MKTFRVTDRFTTKESASFKKYLSDISNIKVFTEEEETECCIRAANGDKKAREELVKRNLRFVVTVAKKYVTANATLEDLVNEGNIGLVLAAERYNVDMGFKFITYAVYWIRKIIYEYISNTSKLIRIPCNKVSSVSKVNSKINHLEQLNSRTVDVREALSELSDVLPEKELKIYETFSNLKVDSLDGIFVLGDSETSLQELIIDESVKSPDFGLTQNDTKKELAVLLNVLKPRDKEIMISLYGLNGNAPLTLEQVSQQVGLTREMIRQIKEKSLQKLQNQLLR
jgi:RNA polymerase primary sigma factor